MKTATPKKFRSLIDARFDGELKAYTCERGKGACVLQAASVMLGLDWTDEPEEIGCFDIRPINDIHVCMRLRIEWMPQVYCAYQDSLDWPLPKKILVARKLVISTVRRLLPLLPELSDWQSRQCRRAGDLQTAALAASRAGCAPARTAEIAAERAASIDNHCNAYGAIKIAADAAFGVGIHSEPSLLRNRVFVAACKIWLQAAREIEKEFA